MKKINIIFVLLINIIYAQISMSDLQSMGNDELDKIRAELEAVKSDIEEGAIPVTDIPISAPVTRQTPSAMALATGSLTAPNSSINFESTCRRFIFASLL